MICSSVHLFFTSNLLLYGIGLQHHLPLKYGGMSAGSIVITEHDMGACEVLQNPGDVNITLGWDSCDLHWFSQSAGGNLH